MAKKRSVPEITDETLAPPYLNYNYFLDAQKVPFRAELNRFDIVNAWWLAEIATLVYAPEEFVREQLEKVALTNVRLFSKDGADCFVIHNDRYVIVAFRGTEIKPRTGKPDFTNIVVDIMTDLEILLVDSGQGGKVHEGFKKSLDKIWDNREVNLKAYLTELMASGAQRKFFFTGHSLGAALATLAADRFGLVQALYTYGSPRVGDENFKRDFFINTYRFVNNNDIVTAVPPPLLYTHVGSFKHIDKDGHIHDNESIWERLSSELANRLALPFNSVGGLRAGFIDLVPQNIKDHVPTTYALHIWNSIV